MHKESIKWVFTICDCNIRQTCNAWSPKSTSISKRVKNWWN